MPSVSKKQHNFMEAVAHNPAFAKKAGVPMSVGKDFSTADKGLKFSKGGSMAKSKEREDFDEDVATAKRALYKQPGEAAIYSRERGLGPSMARRRLEERGVDIPGLVANEPTDSDMKKGGKVKKMAGGGMANKMKMFEKSGKDVEKKGMKEGSKADMAMDRMQMMGMKKGGMAMFEKSGKDVEKKGMKEGQS
jgi:hypothetical protein